MVRPDITDGVSANRGIFYLVPRNMWQLITMGRTCNWCGNYFEGSVWKDGKRVYCSSECHSVALLPVLVIIAIGLSLFLALSFLFPEFFLWIVNRYNNSWLLVYGLYAVIAGVILFSIYHGYKGWKARNEIVRLRDT